MYKINKESTSDAVNFCNKKYDVIIYNKTN